MRFSQDSYAFNGGFDSGAMLEVGLTTQNGAILLQWSRSSGSPTSADSFWQ